MSRAVPPYQDISTLTRNLCISERTVDDWVKEGLLPEPRRKKGKRLWKWTEVEQYMDRDATTVPASPDDQVERIRNATQAAASQGR